MAIFDWNKKIIGIPDDWRQSEGGNVKIAIIDSGVDLTHPALQHLDKDGCKFNVAQPNFDPDDSNQGGNDNVEDAVPFMSAHGTHCTSIIGALPVDNEGIKGIAPKADIVHIKGIDEAKESFLDYFLKGLKIAVREDVDLISVSYFPTILDTVDWAEVDEVFQLVNEKKILIVTTLENTRLLNVLNNLKFCANRETCLVCGKVRKRLLENFPQDGMFNSNISFLFPELEVEYCTLFRSSKYLKGDISSSYVAAAMSGVIALLISHWKNTEADYQRRMKPEIMTALSEIALPFDVNKMLNDSVYQFYNP